MEIKSLYFVCSMDLLTYVLKFGMTDTMTAAASDTNQELASRIVSFHQLIRAQEKVLNRAACLLLSVPSVDVSVIFIFSVVCVSHGKAMVERGVI